MDKEKIYNQIISTLEKLNIPYEEIEHTAVVTTEDSKKQRAEKGWTKGVGSKNILFHAKEKFYLVVTTAEKQIKARKFKKEFGTKNIRFADSDEIDRVTECESGAIPPFGYMNKELPIYVDEEIFRYEYFMFNPAMHTKSIRVKPEDLKEIYVNIKNNVKLFNISEHGIDIKPLDDKLR